MRADSAQRYRLRLGLAAALAIILLAPSRAMSQAGEAGTLPARTAQETAADLQLILDRHLAESRCEDPATQLMRSFEPIVTQLSKTAILYAIPCTAGAYNIAYRLYMRETGEIGGVETLYFATWSGEYGWSGTDLLFNIDADGPRLSAYYQGRGLGDCGTDAQWLWRDYAFRLLRYAAQDTCDGVLAEHWPVIFEYRADGSDSGSAQ
jgi:hypothetical protein